jgi:Flp pilus assembly protein TadG
MRRVRFQRPSSRWNDRRSGTACVEFALLLPFLVTMVLGVIEIGRYVEVRQILADAVREGARQASAGQLTNAQVISVVTGAVKNAGLPTTNLTVTCGDLTNASLDVSNATSLDKLQVTATLLFKDVRWCSSMQWTNNTSLVYAKAIWYSSNPVAYPTNVSAPTGS